MVRDNSIKFRLDGVDYVLRGDKSLQQLENIVRMVEQKISDIRRLAPNYSSMRASTLAALQLAEELMDAREEYAELLLEAGIGGHDDLFSNVK